MLCTARTPEMFSWRSAFTAEIAWRALMKARRANLCQIDIITTSKGMTSRVIRASWASMMTIAAMIPARLRMSAKVTMTMDRNLLELLHVVLDNRHHPSDLVLVVEVHGEALEVSEEPRAQGVENFLTDPRHRP